MDGDVRKSQLRRCRQRFRRGSSFLSDNMYVKVRRMDQKKVRVRIIFSEVRFPTSPQLSSTIRAIWHYLRQFLT